MRGVKVEFKQEFAEGLIKLIEVYLSCGYMQDDDKIVMAGLAEIKHRLSMKMITPQLKYTMTLTPVQSLAIKIFYSGFIQEHTTYIGNKLMNIANATDKLF